MDKTVIGLAAAIGAALPIVGAQAAPVSSEAANQALRVSSIAELLQPVPNAAAILATLDAERTGDAVTRTDGEMRAQWHHHHHHHHHHWGWHHHHHHHHHWHWHHHHHWY